MGKFCDICKTALKGKNSLRKHLTTNKHIATLSNNPDLSQNELANRETIIKNKNEEIVALKQEIFMLKSKIAGMKSAFQELIDTSKRFIDAEDSKPVLETVQIVADSTKKKEEGIISDFQKFSGNAPDEKKAAEYLSNCLNKGQTRITVRNKRVIVLKHLRSFNKHADLPKIKGNDPKIRFKIQSENMFRDIIKELPKEYSVMALVLKLSVSRISAVTLLKVSDYKNGELLLCEKKTGTNKNFRPTGVLKRDFEKIYKKAKRTKVPGVLKCDKYIFFPEVNNRETITKSFNSALAKCSQMKKTNQHFIGSHIFRHFGVNSVVENVVSRAMDEAKLKLGHTGKGNIKNYVSDTSVREMIENDFKSNKKQKKKSIIKKAS